MMRLFFLIIMSVILLSCSKEEKKEQTQRDNDKDQSEESADQDTTMTPEEMFSSALVEDIAGDSDDALEIYLEEQFYPLASRSPKVTLDRVSGSLYLFSYYDNGTMKNYLIQKFYDPGKNEFVYEKSETQSNAVKQFIK